MIIRSAEYRASLGRLVARAQQLRQSVDLERSSAAKHLMRLRADGASIAVRAFVKEVPAGQLYLDAADAVDAVLDRLDRILEDSPDWEKVAETMRPLTDAVKAFAEAVGVPYDAKDAHLNPAKLVAALEHAVAAEDGAEAMAALEGIRNMLGKPGEPALGRSKRDTELLELHRAAHERAVASGAYARQQSALNALLAAHPLRHGQSRRGVMTLSIRSTSDAPPTEFRIFAAGMNRTSNGDGLFDEQAARDVMARFQTHGVDVMIDLEHLSLDDEGPNFDPDARGWCRLEVRNGELWATNVKWTADGEARLREKRQRYISPVFEYEKATRRITNVLNIAITAMPATHKIAPLVAASQ
jgi:hypothetical protein